MHLLHFSIKTVTLVLCLTFVQIILISMFYFVFKYTLSLFLVYPFSLVLYSIPNKDLKHLFSLVVGLVLVQWVFGADWIHSFIVALGTYLICLIAPKKYVHHLGFVFVMVSIEI